MTEFPSFVALALPLTVLLDGIGVGLAVLALVVGMRFPPLALGVPADLRVDRILLFARAVRVGFALVLAGSCGTDLLAGTVSARDERLLAIRAIPAAFPEVRRLHGCPN